MATAFLHTLQSLKADRGRRPVLGLLLVATLLAAWSAWFLLARVARYEVTETARLEVDRATHPIQAPMVGRVVSSRLALGQEVQAGDVLVELDADPERLQIKQERARLNAVEPEILALRDEAAATAQARASEQEATRAAVEEARARFQEGDALSRLASAEAERLARLDREGLIPRRDLDQGKAQADRRRAAAESLRLALERLEREQHTRESDRDVHLKRLQGEISRLEGQRTTTLAAIDRLEYEIERRRIRAPVAGRLGEAATLRIGAVVADGEKLAAVVPSGVVRVVAEFPPAALGRIRAGQPGQLRLHGFPWAQYGSVPLTVSSAGNELRDGRIRVELSIDSKTPSLIPLQHGLPGSVEVEVERVAPAVLVLRAAGRLIGAPVR